MFVYLLYFRWGESYEGIEGIPASHQVQALATPDGRSTTATGDASADEQAPDQRGHATDWHGRHDPSRRGRSQPTDAGCVASPGARLGAPGSSPARAWPPGTAGAGAGCGRLPFLAAHHLSFSLLCVFPEEEKIGKRKKGTKWIGLGFHPLHLYDPPVNLSRSS